ncbi:hypothetical protein [Fischerella thermalis]|uniref:hypothetical protein n=1 Tax=Fischerella thermalis TaxID=372787 RepID=UPI00358DBDFB
MNNQFQMGAQVNTERVVVDRNRITGGGVTAGIDFALTIAGMLCSEDTANWSTTLHLHLESVHQKKQVRNWYKLSKIWEHR